MKPLSKKLYALAPALLAVIPAAAQSRTAYAVGAVRIQPAASLSLQGGAVELKIRLGAGAQGRLWVSDACVAPLADSYVVAQSGTYTIPLSTLAGAGGNACLVSTDGELRASATISPQNAVAVWTAGDVVTSREGHGLAEAAAAEPLRQRHAPREASRSASWLWVHTGVAVQVAGNLGDWATSWKQPEGNQWLAEPGGPYAGKFYRSGTVRKAALSAGLVVVSYAVAWKWPKARKYVGVFNMAIGASFGAAAVSNVVRNPYYQP